MISGTDIINTAEARFLLSGTAQEGGGWQYLYGGNGQSIVTEEDERSHLYYYNSGPGIDCSHLVWQALLAAGYDIPFYMDTTYLNGIAATAGDTYYTTVVGPSNGVLTVNGNGPQIGDVILFNGHTGIITSLGKNYSSANPLDFSTIEFLSATENGVQATITVANWEKWTGEQVTGILEVSSGIYNPTAANEVLAPINSSVIESLTQAGIDPTPYNLQGSGQVPSVVIDFEQGDGDTTGSQKELGAGHQEALEYDYVNAKLNFVFHIYTSAAKVYNIPVLAAGAVPVATAGILTIDSSNNYEFKVSSITDTIAPVQGTDSYMLSESNSGISFTLPSETGPSDSYLDYVTEFDFGTSSSPILKADGFGFTVAMYGSSDMLVIQQSGAASAPTGTTPLLITDSGNNGVIDLSPLDDNDFGTDITLTPDGNGGFTLADSSGLDVDVRGFDTIITGAGNDVIHSSVSDITFIPTAFDGNATGDGTTIYGSTDGTDILDISATDPSQYGDLNPGAITFGNIVVEGQSDLGPDGQGEEEGPSATTHIYGTNEGTNGSVFFENIGAINGINGVTTLTLPVTAPLEPVGTAPPLTSLSGEYTIEQNGDSNTIAWNESGFSPSTTLNDTENATITHSEAGYVIIPLTISGFATVDIWNGVDTTPGNDVGAGKTTNGAHATTPHQPQKVTAGGTANGTDVSGGEQIVGAKGTANSTQVGSASGQATSNVSEANDAANFLMNTPQVESAGGGEQIVEHNGTSNDTTILSNGIQIAESGANINGTVVEAGGALIAESGANISDVTVLSGGYLIVSVAVNSSDITVQSGGTYLKAGVVVSEYPGNYVADTSLTSGVVISSGGTEYVLSSGESCGDVFDSSAQYVYEGGKATSAVLSVGAQYVSSGGMVSGTSVYSAGTVYVSGGGSALDISVYSGGAEVVYSGGLESGATVYTGGVLIELPGAVVSDIAVSGGDVVSSGVVLYNPGSGYSLLVSPELDQTLVSGRIEYILTGGSAYGNTLDSGSMQYLYSGGQTNDTVISSGGAEYAYDGATTNNVVVGSGGEEYIFSGAAASGSTVSSGGQEFLSGGDSYGAALQQSEQWIASGGVAYGTQINRGATQYVGQWGSADGSVVSAGGSEVVFSGGMANNTTLSGGGTAIILGGTGSGLIVIGGLDAVGADGDTIDTVVSSGGEELVSAGASYGTTVNCDGFEVLISSGTAIGATINTSGAIDVFSGGVSTNTTVNALGAEDVFSGGVASGSILSDGGHEIVSGGSAFGAIIDSGGVQFATVSGILSGTTIYTGGVEDLSDGGKTYGTDLIGDGTQQVLSGGIAYDTTISGGNQAVFAGRASGTILKANGYQYVASGGVSIGPTP